MAVLAHQSPANPLAKLEVKDVMTKLEFPSTLVQDIGHYVRFGIREREKKGGTKGLRGGKTVDKALGCILLPMPSSLGTTYAAQYQDTDLGAAGEAGVMLGGAVLNTLSDAAGKITAPGGVEKLSKEITNALSGVWKTGGQVLSNLDKDPIGETVSKINKLGQDIAGSAVGAAKSAAEGVEKVLGSGSTAVVNAMGGDIAKAVIGASKGQVANPHRVVLFTGLPFREFQFSYKLSPRNVFESKTIRNIIYLFKMHMSPAFSRTNFIGLKELGTERAALTYPDIFTIEFANRNYLFDFKPAVLKSFNIQYHPQSYPAYIRDDEMNMIAPAEVTISMTFQELDMIDRDFIKDEHRTRVDSEDAWGNKTYGL